MTAPGGADRTYVLDTGVVVAFQRARALDLLATIGQRARLVVVEEVRDELLDVPPKNESHAREARTALFDPGFVRVESIASADPATAVLRALRAGRTASSDLGEAASIAWASTHAEAYFVLRDAHAALLALEELRGRVLGLYGFLAELVDAGIIQSSAARKAGEAMAVAPGVSQRRPTWWSKLSA